MTTKTIQQDIKLVYPLLKRKERILIWKKVKGMWKNRKPDPIRELKKMREEWR